MSKELAKPQEFRGEAARFASSALRTLTPAAWAILIFSGFLYLLEGLLKPAWADELFQLYTDSLPSFSAVIHNQLAHPFSLEPAGFHVVVHALQCVFGPSIFAERLPSFLFVLMAQVCLYLLAKQFGSERSGLFAMAFPLLTSAFYYAAEGRTYGMIFGLSAIAAFCWIRATEMRERRGLLHTCLAFSLGMICISHFYGVLMVIPFWLAEAARTLRRRRLDVALVVSLAAGSGCVLLDLPFTHAAFAFRSTYFAQTPTWHVIGATLMTSFAFSGARHSLVELAVGGLIVVAIFFLWRRTDLPGRFDFVVLAFGFCALPVFGYALARVTHAFEPRYVLPVLIGFSLLCGIGLGALSSTRLRFQILLSVVAFAAFAKCGQKLWMMRHDWLYLKESFVLQKNGKERTMPPGDVYVQDANTFLIAHYYQPGSYSGRFVLLDSPQVQLERMHYDAPSRIAIAIGLAHPEFRVASYETFRSLPGDHIVLAIQNSTMDDWLRPVLADDGFRAEALGSIRGGVLLRTNPPAHLSPEPAHPGPLTISPASPGQ